MFNKTKIFIFYQIHEDRTVLNPAVESLETVSPDGALHQIHVWDM